MKSALRPGEIAPFGAVKVSLLDDLNCLGLLQ